MFVAYWDFHALLEGSRAESRKQAPTETVLLTRQLRILELLIIFQVSRSEFSLIICMS